MLAPETCKQHPNETLGITVSILIGAIHVENNAMSNLESYHVKHRATLMGNHGGVPFYEYEAHI